MQLVGDEVADQLVLEVISSYYTKYREVLFARKTSVVAASEQRGCPRFDEPTQENACVHSVQTGSMLGAVLGTETERRHQCPIRIEADGPIG